MNWKDMMEKFRPQVMAVIVGIVVMSLAAMRWSVYLGPPFASWIREHHT